MKHFTKLVFVMMIAAGFTGCNNSRILKTIDVTEPDLSAVTNGTYNGKYALKLPFGYIIGFSSAKVNVEVESHCYQSIKVLNMPENFVAKKGVNISKLIEKIIKLQKLNVDGITGASYSMKAVQKAVENAFKK